MYNVDHVGDLRIFRGIFAAGVIDTLVLFDEIKGLSWVSQSLRGHTAHSLPN
jgi:hypothetical protein